MTKTQLLYILLPVVLFLINLIIILVDRRKRRIGPVVKAIHDAKNDLEVRAKSFKSQVGEVEHAFDLKESQVKELIQILSMKAEELNGYSDDFVKLKTAMHSYEKSLHALAKLTEDAEVEGEKIKAASESMGSLRQEIQNIREEFNDFVRDVDILKQKTIDTLEETRGKVNEDSISIIKTLEEKAEAVTKQFTDSTAECINDHIFRIDEAMRISEETSAQLLAKLDAKLETSREVAKALDESGLHLLNDIGDRTYDQMRFHAEIDALHAQKEKLIAQIDNLDQIAAEKKRNASAEQISDTQNAGRLADIKSNIQMLDATPKEEIVEVDSFAEDVFEEAIAEQNREDEEPQLEFTGENEEIIFD